MTCQRCKGCMARDHFVDLMESGGEWWTSSWRCINCGYVLDPVVEQNRRKQQGARSTAPIGVAVSPVENSEQALLEFDVAGSCI